MTPYLYSILLVTGTITCTQALQFAAPGWALRNFNELKVEDELTLFFARALGLAVTAIGALLVWSAFFPALRLPVLLVATVSKFFFVLSLLHHWKSLGRGFALTLAFDSACVLLFLSALLTT